ncbi:hypothetical protein [Sphingomonas immobilis]|uniref:Uncharacterized protein n=1 Tax=Sphingomonas immobilis TaxID=3063997 RepID=A0ABT8ZYA9_9SPHN|nr:hypothetical protein [Sphingomonas sp. CA1-15]MDO7842560.1 hypothetical protein [Sphingomonas sp. CA1-15]
MAAAAPVADITFGWNKGAMATDTTDFDYASAAVPPGALFVAADEPLLVYPSVAAAESHLEAIDVRNGVYPAAYGPNGESYRIKADGDHVVIEPTGESDRPDELSGLLLRYLKATGSTPDATTTFRDLVATVWAIEREFWQEHDPYGDRFGTRISLWGCVGFAVILGPVLYLVFR